VSEAKRAKKENVRVVANHERALFCLPDFCLTFLTADADRECRWRARLAWRVGRENDESEVQDSGGIKRQDRKSQRGQKEIIARLGYPNG
jgi:hypothetical protein